MIVRAKRDKNMVQKTKRAAFPLLCEPAGARTQDPILKRDVLYLLSYWDNRLSIRGCKSTLFSDMALTSDTLFFLYDIRF